MLEKVPTRRRTDYTIAIEALRASLRQLERETGDAEITPEGEALKGMISILLSRLLDPAFCQPAGYDDEPWRSACLARGCRLLAPSVTSVGTMVTHGATIIESIIIGLR
jgi:hypothetical protein